ncbi:hypothetical protein [Streptomyces sp. A5-4]|uniref:hypothetical protein n=1 Tax=Streptomyces sp. A5-4 TaxID=3384771 RepID=UPI003DA82000
MEPVTEDNDESLSADVEEFSTHDRKGGWARARLVARRVEPDEGRGKTIEQQSKCFDRNVYRRISAREFARRTRTSAKRVMAFYEAWDRAAADGIVPSACDLAPGLHVELPDEEEVPFFGEHGYYRSYEASMAAGERRSAIELESERAGVKPTAPVFMAQHPTALRATILADPGAQAAAREAIEECDRREAARDHTVRDAARVTAEEPARECDRTDGADTWSPQDVTEVDVDQVAAAVRSAAQSPAEADVALKVFNELTDVRLGTLRALALLQHHTVHFTDDRSQAITELCTASQAAIAFIRDLAASHHPALNDEALRAFMDESEKLG